VRSSAGAGLDAHLSVKPVLLSSAGHARLWSPAPPGAALHEPGGVGREAYSQRLLRNISTSIVASVAMIPSSTKYPARDFSSGMYSKFMP